MEDRAAVAMDQAVFEEMGWTLGAVMEWLRGGSFIV